MAAGSASSTSALMNKVGWDATKGIVEGTTLEAGENINPRTILPELGTLVPGGGIMERSMSDETKEKPPVKEDPENFTTPGAKGALESEAVTEIQPEPSWNMSLAVAFTCFGLAPSLVYPFKLAFGVEEPEDMAAADFAYMKEEETETCMDSMQVGEESSRQLLGHERGNVRKFFHRLWKFFEDDGETKKTPEVPVKTETITLTQPPETIKHRYHDYLVQGLEGHFKALTEEQLELLSAQYRLATGDDPNEEETPSPMQLSALSGWLAPTETNPHRRPPVRRLRYLWPVWSTETEEENVPGADNEQGRDIPRKGSERSGHI